MAKKVLVNLDMNKNELQNPVGHKLASAPANPVEGQEYVNTTDHKKYIYLNGTWVDETSQGKVYSAGTGIDSTALAAGTIKTSTTVASKTDIHDGSTIFKKNGTAFATITANQTGTINVDYTIPTTASDVGALPSDTIIGDGKVIFQKNGTAFGTVSANQTATTTINYTIPTTAADVGALPSSTVIGDGKVVFQKNGSAIGTITANQTATTTVNFTIPTAVTDLSDASNYALKTDLNKVYKPAGTVGSASDLPTLSASVLGNIYNVTTAFNTTSDFVEGSGKTIKVGNDIAVVDIGTSSSPSYKFNVLGDFIDTSSYDTHIANTTIHVTSTDKTTWDGKQDAISDLETIRSNATAGAGAATTIAGYGDVVTHNSSEFATSAQGAKADTAAQVYSTSNPALTQSSGVCTWTVTHNLGSRNVEVKVYEISTWEEVVTSVALTSTSVATVKLNSTSNIAAATYQVVVAGH